MSTPTDTNGRSPAAAPSAHRTGTDGRSGGSPVDRPDGRPDLEFLAAWADWHAAHERHRVTGPAQREAERDGGERVARVRARDDSETHYRCANQRW